MATFSGICSDRGKIEAATGEQWNKIAQPKDHDFKMIAKLIKKMQHKGIEAFININNHFEGSAPLTIKRLMSS